jgi:hypothetical protein
MTFFNPEEQFIRLLQQAAWRHRALSPAMPPKITLLFFSRPLKHGL